MRKRRTNKELEGDILDALRRVSKSTGLSNVTLSQVASEANVDLKVLKRRFPTEYDLLEAYAAQIDKKVSLFFQESDSVDKVEKYRHIFRSYIKWLDEDEDFRDLLVWELTDSTNKAFESSQRRDTHIVRHLEQDFPPHPRGSRAENLRTRIILYLAGITYLSLYKDGQYFMGVNHKSQEALNDIDQILTRLLEAYFDNTL